jgi:hypothetical protein
VIFGCAAVCREARVDWHTSTCNGSEMTGGCVGVMVTTVAEGGAGEGTNVFIQG